MPDANKYGGNDSWDDYDNINTQIARDHPKIPMPKMPTKKDFTKSFAKSNPPMTDAELKEDYEGIRADRTSDTIARKGGT